MGSKGDSYGAPLASLIQGFQAEGETGPTETYLAEHSELPGPRGNLELAEAFADAVGELAAEDGDLAWAFVDKLASPACDAPTGDPFEFVPFCAAVAAGAVGAVQEAYRADALQLLRGAARDARWRTREAAAMGLQRLLAVDFDRVVDSLSLWVLGDDPLEQRAVAAAVAEPRLLGTPEAARTALVLHRHIIDRMDSLDRTTVGFGVLRQGLSYTVSVVAAALPEEGFAYLRELASSCDHDARRIARENLRKARLTRKHPKQVEEVEALLLG